MLHFSWLTSLWYDIEGWKEKSMVITTVDYPLIINPFWEGNCYDDVDTVIFHDSFITNVAKKRFFKIFCNSEVSASELLKDFEEMFSRYPIDSLQSSITHWFVTRCKGVKRLAINICRRIAHCRVIEDLNTPHTDITMHVVEKIFFREFLEILKRIHIKKCSLGHQHWTLSQSPVSNGLTYLKHIIFKISLDVFENAS